MSDPAKIAGHVSLNMKITLVSSISTGTGDEPKLFMHTGGHVYPSWAPEEIVKFFKNHRQA